MSFDDWMKAAAAIGVLVNLWLWQSMFWPGRGSGRE